jgi:hypothetical protein
MSQSQQILNHLRRAPLDPLTALKRYGVGRLAARVWELRWAGYRIHTQTVRQGGKRFARYQLV